MRVLLDENIPHQLRAHLPEHDVFTAVDVGFGGFKNGELLEAAENAGYDVLLTGDLSLEYQQNMTGREIAQNGPLGKVDCETVSPTFMNKINHFHEKIALAHSFCVPVRLWRKIASVFRKDALLRTSAT